MSSTVEFVAFAATERAGDWSAAMVLDGEGTTERVESVSADQLRSRVQTVEDERRPRWVWWGHETARSVASLGLPLGRCWDLAAVHRLLHGGWRADPALVWGAAHDLDVATIPELRAPDLFNAFDDHDPDRAVGDDGHLDPAWAGGSWAETCDRLTSWAGLALEVRARQEQLAISITDRPGLASTIRSESTATLLAAELEVTGLPIDLDAAAAIITEVAGPRPSDLDDERAIADRRDAAVLRHVPDGDAYDLRSPEQVKALLRRCGIEVPDTRSWRLERLVDIHPVVAPLLHWRKAERIATTFGHGWLDAHVGRAGARVPATRGRLRGEWSSSDGAAGRMTATAGLHNMPAEIRPAVRAEPDHVFVRADLGQIEPRVLAAVSGDDDLARATADDDMYAPVADRLRVEREIAKVAVLGAMYGQTTGVGAQALRGLERAYPVAMGFLTDADRAAQGGNDLRTVGGRLVRMTDGRPEVVLAGDDSVDRARAAARGRYGRNAMVQGAAAEFFKIWALLVRAAVRLHGGVIVLCLHDELVVHTPVAAAEPTAAAMETALDRAARHWRPNVDGKVRFVADTSVIQRWSDAK
ncbi:MAG: DNA polymerase [Actinomycetota bacterium]